MAEPIKRLTPQKVEYYICDVCNAIHKTSQDADNCCPDSNYKCPCCGTWHKEKEQAENCCPF